MKLAVFFGALVLTGLASAAPTTDDTTNDTTTDVTTNVTTTDDDKVIVTKEFFKDAFAKYTAEHDIVNMLLPLNDLNFEDDDDEGSSETNLFFVEADTDENGKRVDQGLYVMKNYNVTKLLDHGRDASAANENTKLVYFAAKEGLYVYNATLNKAEKYGPITDSIISIAKVNGSDLIYILTEDHVLYKVTDDGTTKTKVDGVVDAQQIVLDYESNLYYYTGDKQVYVLTSEGVKKIEGLPAATYINILKPPFIYDNGVPVVINDKAYIVYVNGTVELTDFEFVDKPTAFSMEGTLIQYFAYNKKIYEYNVLEILASEFLTEVKDFLDDKTDAIQSIATRSRGELITTAEETATVKDTTPETATPSP